MTADIANTRVSILRGTTTNSAGDVVDDINVLFGHVPAVLTETGRTIQDPSTTTPRVVREVVCHVPWWTGALDTDRVVDETTGDTYIVLAVTRPPTLSGAPVDYLLQMKRPTGTGP